MSSSSTSSLSIRAGFSQSQNRDLGHPVRWLGELAEFGFDWGFAVLELGGGCRLRCGLLLCFESEGFEWVSARRCVRWPRALRSRARRALDFSRLRRVLSG